MLLHTKWKEIIGSNNTKIQWYWLSECQSHKQYEDRTIKNNIVIVLKEKANFWNAFQEIS